MDKKEEDGLSADKLLAILTGKCVHEVQLGRVMGLLGLAAIQAGGKPELRLDDLRSLEGRGIAIAIDERSGTATVEVTDRPPEQANVEPTHEAPPTVQ